MKTNQYNVIYQLVDRHVEQGLGDKICLVDEVSHCSYSQLLSYCIRIQQLISSFSIKRKNIVVCILYDKIKSAATFLGLIRAGYIPAYVNPDLPVYHYVHYIHLTESALVIFDEMVSEDIKMLVQSLKISYLELSESLFEGAINDKAALDLGNYERGAFCLFTSGTTGAAKAVIHRHKDIQRTNEHYAKSILDISPNDVTYSTSKLFFAYGLNSLFYALYHGAAVVI